jgi:putative PEP-CTERM system TPR-repeat lipoprotein
MVNFRILGLFFPALLVIILSSCGNQTKEEMLLEGNRLLEEGNAQGSVVLYKNALEKDQNYFEARYQLADAYLLLGRNENAERELEKVSRQNPDLRELSLKFAELYIRTDRTEKAIDVLQRYRAEHGEESRVLDLLGRAHAAAGDHEKAMTLFNSALKLDPVNPDAMLHLAQLYLKQDNEHEARVLLGSLLRISPQNSRALYLLAQLELSVEEPEKALQCYLQLMENNPADVHAAYMAGSLYLGMGEIEQGSVFAENLLQGFPNKAEGHQLSGMVAFSRKDYGAAVVELQKSLRLKEALNTYYLLGLSYDRLGKSELALNQFQKVLDLQPEAFQARNMLAMTLLKQGRVEEAIVEAQRVLKLDPGNGLAHNLLGSAYMAASRFDEAMAEFEQATQLDPQLADAYLKMGLFNLSTGNAAQAEEELAKAIAAAPEVLDNRLILASHYLRQQNFPGAMELMKQGLNGGESDALLYDYMARIAFSQNKTDDGIAYLKKAQAVKPDYFSPYFDIAFYETAMGNYSGALAQYQRVLQIEPENLKALLARGSLLDQMGNKKEARASYELAKKTGELQGYLALGRFAHDNKKNDEALAVVREGLERLPANPFLLEFEGKILLEQGKTDQAIRVFENLEKAVPGRGTAIIIEIYLKQGEKQKAIAKAEAVISRQPDLPAGYLLLSHIYENQGEAARALDLLKGALADCKNREMLQMRMAGIHENSGSMSKAMELYQELEKTRPDFFPAVFALGRIHDQRGNKVEALKCYQKVLERAGNFVPALNNLAYLYADNYGNREEALKLAIRAFRNDPQNPGVMDTLGYVLLKNDRAADAVKVLEKAVVLLNDNPTVWYHLALAYEALGNRGKAIDLLSRAANTGDFPEAVQTRELLKKLRG